MLGAHYLDKSDVMVEEDMAGAGRGTAAFGDWLSTGNSNSISGKLCWCSSSSNRVLNHIVGSMNSRCIVKLREILKHCHYKAYMITTQLIRNNQCYMDKCFIYIGLKNGLHCVVCI